jgi:hypothetical protein
MSSSTSSSSPEPTIAVVIGANAPPERLAACLEALESQRDDGVEVRVHEAVESPRELRERFPWATYTTSPGALVPHHWRDGIDAARSELVALTISQMIPSADWIGAIRRELAEGNVVGGAIDPSSGLRIVDWAEYFCRYSRDMLPFERRDTVDLPGDNAAYRRERLEEVRDTFRDGFWEPHVHRALADRGVRLPQSPELVVRQGRSAGFGAFAAQRRQHGRAFGRQRGAAFSAAGNLAAVARSPLVPLLMTLRVVRLVFGKRRARLRLAVALPALVAFNVIWAASEARGHLDVLLGRA